MARELILNGQRIHPSGDCYVIAEIGHNHQGELQKAKDLFRAAKESGADAVKLQKRDNRGLFTRAAFDKPYEHPGSFGATYGEHREFLEFGRDEYRELQDYADELGVTFFATAFDIASADFLAELDMPAYKIASGDLRNLPLLEHVASLGKPMLVSTGGGSMEDVERACETVLAINPDLCLMQCTATYPAPAEEMELRVIETFMKRFPEVVIGLSDHYNGIAMAVVAYVLGARMIEKHFTLNHTWKGSDHAMSLEPVGFSKMVRDLRRCRLALGDGLKKVFPSEEPAIQKMGKRLVARRPLLAGHVLERADVAEKSPGGGTPPSELDGLLGRRLVRALEVDDDLAADVVESR